MKTNKRILLFLFFFFSFGLLLKAQSLEFEKKLASYHYQFHKNIAYDIFERTKLDLFYPENFTKKTPLIIFVHGGGFSKGDKNHLYDREKDLISFLENQYAVATINYRYYKMNDSLGVKNCLHDVQTALQYLRFNASKYNIDKNKVGMYGFSAGAGSSLYFALHDDLKIEGDSTLRGESTRIQCAGAFETQATYNVFGWKKVVPYFEILTVLKRKSLFQYAAGFYGYENYKSFRPYRKEVTQSVDMLKMIDEKDPPIYLHNCLKENFPKDFNILFHHKKHAIKLAKKLKRNHVNYFLFTHKEIEKEEDKDFTIGHFFKAYL